MYTLNILNNILQCGAFASKGDVVMLNLIKLKFKMYARKSRRILRSR